VLEALLRDEHRFLPLSGLLLGFHGLDGVCLSLPRIVTRIGNEAPPAHPYDCGR
jgi:L-lactate dehydrogenase